MTLFSFSHSHCLHASTRRAHKHRAREFKGLEPFESRTLLSAAIQVTGNTIPIANNDSTPSLGDFTDFGFASATFNPDIGNITATFSINNNGDTPLTLTGGNNQIKVTGPNARDFALTFNAGPTIDAGAHSTFTLAFLPTGAGTRRATVSISTNDPTTPSFTFKIQATAVRTTTAADGLQVATLTKGKGPAAVNGAALLLNYTAFTLSTKFESSRDPGNSPINLALGMSPTIAGMTQGLAGIKAGETRLLVIPAALAYGSNSNGLVPPNSPLLFQVTATTMTNPVINVSGKNVPIAFNDKTPSPTDGTFLGTASIGSSGPGPVGSTPLTATFTITNGTDGIVVFPTAPIVTFTGKDAASFSASNLTFDGGATSGTFTITYQPAAVAGTQTAVVHIRSSDPIHKDFTFTVSAATAPAIDFAATSVGTINYPASGTTAAGASTKFKVPVTLTNTGNANIPGSTAPLQVTFYLHDTTSGTDTLISTQTSTAFRGTAKDKSKSVPFTITIPGSVPAGTYQLLVKINENNAVPDTSASNNSMLSTQLITVTT